VTQLHSPTAPLGFVAIVESSVSIEIAAISVDRKTLDIRSSFTGRIGPLDGVRRPPEPHKPRWMLHTELALGIGSVIEDTELVAWHVHLVRQRLDDHLAMGGRVFDIAGCFDLYSAVTPILEAAGTSTYLLDDAAVAFGLPAPEPDALSQVRTAIAVLQRARARAGLGEQWARLASDERKIVELAVQRLNAGSAVYGAWNIDDGRVYEREAAEEAADGFMYSLAALIRSRRDTPRSDRGRIAYLATGLAVDHPTVLATTKRLLSRRILAIHPERVTPDLVREGVSEIDAKKMLVEFAHEVCVVGSIDHPAVTEAMTLAHAHCRTISFAPSEVLA
jgi:hypothetical protein